MPTYKFTYFNVTALGEGIRFLLHYGGQKFEDIRIEGEQWPKLKASTPMGQLPVLEIDGKKVWQSQPILRYLGKLYGVAGKDDWENLQIDVIAASVDDFRAAVVKHIYEPNEDAKARLKETALKESLPFFTKKLNDIAGENNGYLALGRLTWADFFFAGVINYLNFAVGEDILAKNPNLKAVVDHVHQQKGVKEYIASRPNTTF